VIIGEWSREPALVWFLAAFLWSTILPKWEREKLMKNGLLVAAMAAFLFTAAPAARAQDAVMVGPGTVSCGTYLSRRASDPGIELLFFSWAQGYLSRMNYYETQLAGMNRMNLKPSGFDVSQQIDWVNNYCSTNRSQGYSKAVFELYRRIRSYNGYTS
jgi:hypothetical protein